MSAINVKIVYLLNIYPGIGCLPECVAVDVDTAGVFSIRYVRIVNSNISNYDSLLDDNDRQMIEACWKLSPASITERLNLTFQSFDLLVDFLNNSKSTDSYKEYAYLRNYSFESIGKFQNIFFEYSASKALYLPTTNFPFGWTPVTIVEDMPELFYFANLHAEGMDVSLLTNINNVAFNMTGAKLLTRSKARILHRNKIIEFDDFVLGEKLTPYFKKKQIRVPLDKTKEYISKILFPVIRNEKLIADGIKLNYSTELRNAVIRVKEYGVVQETSLFGDDENSRPNAKEIVFDLLFEYDDFMFVAGREGAMIKMIDDEGTGQMQVFSVVRAMADEKYYIEHLQKLGFDLDAKVKKMSFSEGLDLLNLQYRKIEDLGIEIRFERKNLNDKKYFVGKREIEVVMTEARDWFDLKAQVSFGDYQIPFIKIFQSIKLGRNEILLPDGTFANIPLQWIEEFKDLFDLAHVENGRITVAKHYCVLAKELGHSSHLKLSVKSNMRKFMLGQANADLELPNGFEGTLRDYQLDGYRWMRTLDSLALGGCLADDMGLGKTIQTICMLQWLVEQQRRQHLIVVPTSLIFNWQEEFARFAPQLKIYVHTGQLRSRTLLEANDADILLTSYSILRRDKSMFEHRAFDYFILDESQGIKNPHSDISKVCFSIKAKRFLTLTGTPLENSVSDLWSQVHFFNRNMLGSLRNFETNCKLDDKMNLYRMLLKPFMLRRLKTEVLKDLPEKQIVLQYCDMLPEQQHYYNGLRNGYINKFIEAKTGNASLRSITVLEGLLRMRQAANHPVMVDKSYQAESGKMQMVMQKLQEVLAQGSKVLIFSSFVEHLKIYKSALDQQSIPYAYLDGSTKDRQAQVEQFQTDENISVFMLSLKSGGVGLNLTKADYVFLLDPWWNPAAEAQAYDRAHRIGQKSNVFVYKFITTQTIEEKIVKLQDEKNELFQALIGSTDSLLKGMDINKILSLLD